MDMPEAELITLIREFRFTPESILENREMIDLVLPVLRADLQMSLGYSVRPEAALTVPVWLLGAEGDAAIDAKVLQDWRDLLGPNTTTQMFPGGHLYLFENPERFLAAAKAIVTQIISSGETMSTA